MAVLTIGLGAGVGSFLAWIDRDLSRSATILMLFLAIAASLIGAWVDLHESKDAYKLVGRPRSPALTRIVIGAILGGAAFNLPLCVFKTVRSPRI